MQKTIDKKTFILIFGPPAVGKMTIGQELEKLTGMKLFHNHMILDPLLSIFGDYNHNLKNLVFDIRSRIFDEVVQSQLPGFIFTFVWNFDKKYNSQSSVDIWIKTFKKARWQIYCIELLADLETRLIRNKTNNRIIHKKSKQDIAKSENILLQNEIKWCMRSEKNFNCGDKFLRIENGSNKTVVQIAKEIKNFFNL